MEANPYSAPGAEVEDVRNFSRDDIESRKATRGKRLGAALLDGLTYLLWLAPLFAGVGMKRDGIHSGTGGSLIVLSVVLALGVVVLNLVWLSQRGQSIGKRVLDIAIVRTDGSPVTLGRVILLRALPLMLAGAIPFVGRYVGLVDSLMIFGSERRCLHDLIADTIVVDV